MWIHWDALVLLGALRALVSVGWLRCYGHNPVGDPKISGVNVNNPS